MLKIRYKTCSGYCPGLDDVENTLQYKNLFNIGPHETRAPLTDKKDDELLKKLRFDCQVTMDYYVDNSIKC